MTDLFVECGVCAGPLHFATCPEPDHDWAIASECQGKCGATYMIDGGCPECSAGRSTSSKSDYREETP